MAGYVCKIVIEDSHPPIWRRVIIPDKVTFFDVHRIIQILFGWEDMHLHEFTLPGWFLFVSLTSVVRIGTSENPEASRPFLKSPA